jgi:hypothetical protein
MQNERKQGDKAPTIFTCAGKTLQIKQIKKESRASEN